MTPLSYEKDMKEMNEKQYEAFRLECARREGFEYDHKTRHFSKNGKGFITQPTYADHDSLHRVLLSMSEEEQHKWLDELIVIVGRYTLNITLATIEQKQAALCAVFGLEGK